MRQRNLKLLRAACLLSAIAIPTVAWADDEPSADSLGDSREIVVTASTTSMLGIASTSSQGMITRQEIEQRPAYRVGQYLESIPGLAVTSHSGEGKANQYLLRGFNLDHGTDFATWIDGMPVNQRTHTHGQGYTDINFVIPELFDGIAFTKGAYFPAEGDFSAVGSAHLRLVNTMRPMVSVGAGTVGDRRIFAGGSVPTGNGGNLLGAAEVFKLDGPWDNPEKLRRLNGVVRWSNGTDQDGLSLTAMAYDGRWNATTDQPLRAVEAGLIGRFGSLDPSDGGKASRYSVSFGLAKPIGDCDITVELFGVRQHLTLWSNFTHFLNDPVRGDQHAQNDDRWIGGGKFAIRHQFETGGISQSIAFGTQARFDSTRVNLRSTQARIPFATDRDNQVEEFSLAGYVEYRAQWTPWLRSVVGLRQDYFHVHDEDLVRAETGREHATLFQPKGNLIFAPWKHTEISFSAGRGFHSNDGRAGRVEDENGNVSFERPPLLVKSDSFEAGVRTNAIARLTMSATVFQTDFSSELVYSADEGQTEAGRPSRRRGIEFTAQYRPFHWLEVNTNLAFSHARYRNGDSALRFIEDAPSFIGAAGILVDNLGPWSGALTWRKLGSHPLLDDNSVRSTGYSEVNFSASYKVNPKLTLRAEVYNLFDSGDNAADYYYASRLPGESAGGVEGLNFHPLEPRSLRVTVSMVL
ncbi:MAG: TonB-dependent receptor [Sphingobium sp.]